MANNLDAQRIATMVREFLTERFDIAPERMSDTVTFRDLGLDSIMMLDMMLEAEDRLGIKLRDLALPPNPRLQDIVALIQRNLAPEG
jgi:acyl carrier protein